MASPSTEYTNLCLSSSVFPSKSSETITASKCVPSPSTFTVDPDMPFSIIVSISLGSMAFSINVFISLSRNTHGSAAVEKYDTEPIILTMSWKTLTLAIIILLIVVGLSKFFGAVKEKQDTSSTYLQETVDTVGKVKEMKSQRSKTIEEQESALGDWE